MKNSSELNYRRPFFFAIAFHLILLLLFLFRFNFDDTAHAPSTEIVQATLITSMPVASPASEPISALQPLVEQKPVVKKEAVSSLPEEAALPQQKQSSSVIVQKENIEHITEVQKAAEKELLLAKKQQIEKETVRKTAMEKQKQLAKEQQIEEEKQQRLQAEMQRQLEKERQQKRTQALAKKQQKEIEKLLQQDLVTTSAAKTNMRNTSIATKQVSASSTNIDSKEIDRYKSLIVSAISHRWIVPENLQKGLECRLKVHLAPGGVVMSVKLVKTSGDTALDRSAESAIYKASPLPVPKNTALFNEFREFNLTVRPEGILAD